MNASSGLPAKTNSDQHPSGNNTSPANPGRSEPPETSPVSGKNNPSQSQKDRAELLTNWAVMLNLEAFSLSYIGIGIEVMACAGGPLGCAAGLTAYQPLNNLENILGTGSFFLTAVADFDLGNNYLIPETGEISIGQDTIASGITTGLAF